MRALGRFKQLEHRWLLTGTVEGTTWNDLNAGSAPAASVDGLADDVTDVIMWQGREVEVYRGEWIVSVSSDAVTNSDALHAPLLVEELTFDSTEGGSDSYVSANTHVSANTQLSSAAIQVGRQVGSSGHYLFQFSDERTPAAVLNTLAMTPGFQLEYKKRKNNV